MFLFALNQELLTHAQSEEIISPEDEIDDPMAIDEVLTPVAVASPLPVRSGTSCIQISLFDYLPHNYSAKKKKTMSPNPLFDICF